MGSSKIASEMNRGFLQILVLIALETPMYGYMMIRYLQEQGYSVEENTLYPILRRMEKNGWLESRWDVQHDRPKKYYEITGEGREVRATLLEIRQTQNQVLDRLQSEILGQ